MHEHAASSVDASMGPMTQPKVEHQPCCSLSHPYIAGVLCPADSAHVEDQLPAADHGHAPTEQPA